MSSKRKHRTAAAFIRYLKGELTGEERHNLERSLETDPFEKEALEGMESIDPDLLEQDFMSLQSRIRRRSRRKRRIAYYSIAATVASLLVVGTIFLRLYEFSPESVESVEGLEERPVLKERAPEPREGIEETRKESEEPQEGREEPRERREEPREGREQPLVQEETSLKREVTPRSETEPERRVAQPESPASPDQKRTQKKATPPDSPRRETTKGVTAAESTKGITAAKTTEDDTPITHVEAEPSETTPNQSIIPEQKELAGKRKMEAVPAPSREAMVDLEVLERAGAAETIAAESVAEESGTWINSEALPSVGLKAYREYLENEIRPPAELASMERAASRDSVASSDSVRVVLQFIVDSTGQLGQFQPLETPGESFTREAIRVVSQGPPWTPALLEGKTVKDTVRLNIPFRE